MSDNRIGTNAQQDSGLRIKIDQSRARQTANTSFGHVMSEGLSRTTDAVLQAGQLAAPFIPGGAVLSAAITGVGSLKTSAAGATGSSSAAMTGASSAGNASGLSSSSGVAGGAGGQGGSSLDALAAGGDKQAILQKNAQNFQEMSMSFNMQYLMLQQKMQDESRRFTVVSNIMKTKHDTSKNSISNVR